ncbi:hypothetical protein CH359_15115 [Leptospira meyeri]|nr:hypothetical protein CH359_15115 [Leptospira meyeri]PJZ96179.1 hypothetical protein CH358_14795 [Leptospira meyeri]
MLELEAHASSRVLAVAAVPLGAPQAFPQSWLIRINSGWRKKQNLCRMWLKKSKIRRSLMSKDIGLFYFYSAKILKLVFFTKSEKHSAAFSCLRRN